MRIALTLSCMWMVLAFTPAQRLYLLPKPNDSNTLYCTPTLISRNYQVLAGICFSRASGSYGVYWQNGQVWLLPAIPAAITADGRRIALGGGYWENGVHTLIYPQNPNRTVAPASMTPDGRVIIGRIQANEGVRTFRWAEGEGLDVHRASIDQPRWVRPDGNRIYGAIFLGDSTTQWAPYYTDDLCTYEPLVEQGAPYGDVIAVSDDEAFVLLRSTQKSWLWVQPERTAYEVDLLPDARRMFALTMDGDGVVYGLAQGSGWNAAFRWSLQRGSENLNNLYPCVLPEGWYFHSVQAVSYDGRYLAGRLQNATTYDYQAFLLDTESGLPGDVDGNGCVDDADLLIVLFNFGAQGRGLSADVNCDGIVDDADLLTVLFNFGSGC